MTFDVTTHVSVVHIRREMLLVEPARLSIGGSQDPYWSANIILFGDTICLPNFRESADVCRLEVGLGKFWPQESLEKKTAAKYCIGLERKFGMGKRHAAMRGTPS